MDSPSVSKSQIGGLNTVQTKDSFFSRPIVVNGSQSTENKDLATNYASSGKSELRSGPDASGRSGFAISDLNSEKASLLYEFLLEQLGFASMQEREEEVPEAHKRTFEWIFDLSNEETVSTSRNDFGQWARTTTGDKIYWINGKPGSGKSTLLRFLNGHRKTQDYLRTWAGSKPVVNAVFFFWISGSLEQRSQTGFFRSLLHQLLNAHRKLIPVTFPDLWATLWACSTRERLRMSFNWSLSQLITALDTLLEKMSKHFKLCLFVDGLDELEGDHQELVDIFKNLTSKFSDVKICLSSRPFPVFEKAFRSCPTMKLQDLTFQDMADYVRDTISKHPLAGQELKCSSQLSMKLVSSIATKADGVFLWVRLVTRFLLETWQDGDTIFNALFRLRSLPTELDSLFRYFLFDSQPIHHTTIASKIFQHIRAREGALTFTKDAYSASLKLWEIALADEEFNQLACDEVVHEANDEEILRICELARDKIGGCCGGLLEIHQRNGSKKEGAENDARVLAKSKVNYTHRTARDFLMFSGVWDQLLALTSCVDFDPHLDHIRSYILRLKIFLYPVERHRRLEEWWPDLVLAMTHARFAGPSTKHMQRSLLDELDKTLDQHWNRKRSDPHDNWPRSAFFTYEKRGNEIFHDPFLSLAAKFGLSQYLDAKFATENIKYKSGQPLLSYGVEFFIDRRKSVYPLLDPQLILTLLKGGQNSNQAYTDVMTRQRRTPWLYVLRCVREADRRGWIKHYDVDPMGVERWVAIMISFVNYGADPNAMIEEDGWDPSATALEVIDVILQKYASRHVLRLRNLLVEKGARSRKQIIQ
ncbi:MAG: hypothetical protein Q9160_006528 [Pyrenula sp. 1 TL-2023]